MSLRFLLILTAGSALASCGPSLEDRLNELVIAKDRWVAQAGNRAYSYELQTNINRPYKVVVTEPGTLRDDWMENPHCTRPGICRFDPNMRELFQLVLDLTGEHLEKGGKLEIDYDEELGYPTRIFWDDRSGSHSAHVITVSNIEFAEE